VGWEKVACWSTKSGNISETRKDRGKVTMDGVKSPTLFQTVPFQFHDSLVNSDNVICRTLCLRPDIRLRLFVLFTSLHFFGPVRCYVWLCFC